LQISCITCPRDIAHSHAYGICLAIRRLYSHAYDAYSIRPACPSRRLRRIHCHAYGSLALTMTSWNSALWFGLPIWRTD